MTTDCPKTVDVILDLPLAEFGVVGQLLCILSNICSCFACLLLLLIYWRGTRYHSITSIKDLVPGWKRFLIYLYIPLWLIFDMFIVWGFLFHKFLDYTNSSIYVMNVWVCSNFFSCIYLACAWLKEDYFLYIFFYPFCLHRLAFLIFILEKCIHLQFSGDFIFLTVMLFYTLLASKILPKFNPLSNPLPMKKSIYIPVDEPIEIPTEKNIFTTDKEN